MKVLLVTPDLKQLQNLTEVFRVYDETLVLETADSAFFALTRLERDAPDLIVSAGDVGMSGAEFLEILRADAFLGEIPFILLDETALTELAPGAGEIVLGAHASPALILGAAKSLLARAARPERDDERTSTPPRVNEGVPVLQGTTRLVSPFDLVTILAKEHNTGRLTFDLNERSALRFVDGKLVHAEFEQLVGEAALVETFRAVYAVGNVCFQYHADVSAAPSTVLPDDSSANLSNNLSNYPNDPPNNLHSAGGASLAGSLQVLLLRVALELDRDLT